MQREILKKLPQSREERKGRKEMNKIFIFLNIFPLCFFTYLAT